MKSLKDNSLEQCNDFKCSRVLLNNSSNSGPIRKSKVRESDS